MLLPDNATCDIIVLSGEGREEVQVAYSQSLTFSSSVAMQVAKHVACKANDLGLRRCKSFAAHTEIGSAHKVSLSGDVRPQQSWSNYRIEMSTMG